MQASRTTAQLGDEDGVAMPGALDGVKILELSEILAGPFGGMLLADLGADVIKVEPPTGDPWRHQSPGFAPGENRSFLSLNRGKRGLAVDLKTDEGREIIYRLIPEMDLVIVNYRPDTPKRLGVDYETLSAINPRLVYVSETAFGPHGSNSHRPGYDLIAQAMTGIMAADGKTDENGVPRPVSPAVADMSTGYVIAWAACSGLFARERTGKGQKIECSLLSTALGMLTSSVIQLPDIADNSAAALADIRMRELRAEGASYPELLETMSGSRAVNAYYRCYATKDSLIAVAALSEPLRRKTAAALEIDDPRFHDPDLPKTGPEANAIANSVLSTIAARMTERTTAEWLEVLDAAGVPGSPVRFPYELMDDPDLAANGLSVEVQHSLAGRVRMIGSILGMSATPAEITTGSPTLGQHTDEILARAGYVPEDIAALRTAGVVV